VSIAVAVLPEEVLALTVSTFVPVFILRPLTDQLVVPCAVPPQPLLLVHVTLVTLADAVPARVSGLLFVL
jgi:hypothetical protein